MEIKIIEQESLILHRVLDYICAVLMFKALGFLTKQKNKKISL